MPTRQGLIDRAMANLVNLAGNAPRPITECSKIFRRDLNPQTFLPSSCSLLPASCSLDEKEIYPWGNSLLEFLLPKHHMQVVTSLLDLDFLFYACFIRAIRAIKWR